MGADDRPGHPRGSAMTRIQRWAITGALIGAIVGAYIGMTA